MSWDSYIDNLIGHTSGACDKAAIIGQDGSKWTTDGHSEVLKVAPSEASAIGKTVRSGDFTPFQTNGIMVAGVKYVFLRADDGVVLGKKKDQGAITLQASGTAVVIGHTKEGMSQGNTNKGVAAIAEYLMSMGM